MTQRRIISAPNQAFYDQVTQSALRRVFFSLRNSVHRLKYAQKTVQRNILEAAARHKARPAGTPSNPEIAAMFATMQRQRRAIQRQLTFLVPLMRYTRVNGEQWPLTAHKRWDVYFVPAVVSNKLSNLRTSAQDGAVELTALLEQLIQDNPLVFTPPVAVKSALYVKIADAGILDTLELQSLAVSLEVSSAKSFNASAVVQ